MGILRGIDINDAEPLLESVISAGLETIEVTMNTPGAIGIISRLKKISDGRISVGAGTVLAPDQAGEALDAGAEFIVMPSFEEDVVSYCVGKDIPVFPGAFTPNEVIKAWRSGAAMVKVFPCGLFGPKYIKELKGPFDGVSLMAVGGVRADNIGEYFSCGADAVAFGGSVFKKEWIAGGMLQKIKDAVKEYVDAVRKNVSPEQAV